MTKRLASTPQPDPHPERSLPYNLDAERSVLGVLLMHNSQFERISDTLKDTDFFRAAHQDIWRAIAAALNTPRGTVDPITLRAELTRHGTIDKIGGPAYLAGLTDGLPRSTNIEHYANLVREMAVYRQLIKTASHFVAKGYEAEVPAHLLLIDADKAILDLQRGTHENRMQSLSESASDLFENLEFRHKNKGLLSGVDTGFKSINELTNGWQSGDMVVIAARPSVGKTAFVLNSALAGVQTVRPDGSQRHALIFSMEMRRQQLEYRILSSLSGVALSRLLSGYVYEQEMQTKLADAIGIMHNCGIHIDDTAGRTVWEIRTACRRAKAEHGLDLVVIDYIQLMPGTLDRRGASRNEEVTDISRRLKTMADELGVPVLVLSQLNRNSEGASDPKPKLSSLRESGALEQDADLVCFLHRKNHRAGGVTNFIIEKQRNGPTGTVNISLDRDTTRFTDGGEEAAPTAEELEKERQAQVARQIRRKRRA